MDRLHSRLIAQHGTRHLDAISYADAAADGVDRAIVDVWNRLMAILKTARGATEAHQQALEVLGELPKAVGVHLGKSLELLAGWSFRSAARILTDTLPLPYLRSAANDLPSLPEGNVGGGRKRGIDRLGMLERARSGDDPSGLQLLEDFVRQPPGAVELGLTPKGRLSATDRLAPLREPAKKKTSDDEQRRQLGAVLFPAPSQSQVLGILERPIAGRTWYQDLSKASRYADPQRLAHVLAAGFAAGDKPSAIAQALLPAVQQYKTSARRIARTYGVQVAHAAQFQAHAGVDDLLAGYQIHALLDQHTRPHHAARSGTIYYKQPKSGEKSVEDMPHPPLEADGSMAWNCRCHLTPVLKPVEAIAKSPVFTNAADKLIPDPAVYSDWFDQADEKRQRMAVGSRRYSYLADQLPPGIEPTWADFVDPETGQLRTLNQLKDETGPEWAARVAKVKEIVAANKRAISQTAIFGFIPPEPPQPELVPPREPPPMPPPVKLPAVAKKIAEQAAKEGIDPNHLHGMAQDRLKFERDQADEHNHILRQTRDMLKEFGGEAKTLHLHQDKDWLRGLDEAADYWQNHGGRPDLDAGALLDILREGNKPKPSVAQIYREELEEIRAIHEAHIEAMKVGHDDHAIAEAFRLGQEAGAQASDEATAEDEDRTGESGPADLDFNFGANAAEEPVTQPQRWERPTWQTDLFGRKQSILKAHKLFAEPEEREKPRTDLPGQLIIPEH